MSEERTAELFLTKAGKVHRADCTSLRQANNPAPITVNILTEMQEAYALCSSCKPDAPESPVVLAEREELARWQAEWKRRASEEAAAREEREGQKREAKERRAKRSAARTATAEADAGRYAEFHADTATALFAVYDLLDGILETADGEPIEYPAAEVEILVIGGCTLGDFRYAVDALLKAGRYAKGSPWGYIRTVTMRRRAMVMDAAREGAI